MKLEIQLGAYDNVAPPLPIPNREVKCVDSENWILKDLRYDKEE